jgi:hypothetical protein
MTCKTHKHFSTNPVSDFFNAADRAIADGEPARLLDIPAFGFLRTLVAAIIGVIVVLFGWRRLIDGRDTAKPSSRPRVTAALERFGYVKRFLTSNLIARRARDGLSCCENLR